MAALKELQASVANGVTYDPDEEVVVIVEVEGDDLLDYAGEDVADFAATSKGKKVNKNILAEQKEVKDKISAEVKDASFEESYSYTAVMNTFTVSTAYKDLAQIENISGVKCAYVAGKYDIPVTDATGEANMASSTQTIGSNLANNSGYTGKGVAVAILDTGLDYKHEAFSMAPEDAKYTQEEMKETVDFYGDLLNSGKNGSIISDKVIYAYDYADEDGDVYPGGSTHGVHVAGTVAGYYENEEGEVVFSGVAPDAQLMIMKVFGDVDTGASDVDIVAALEDAVLLGADVINMSLGSPAGFTESSEVSTKNMYDRIAEAGVNLMVSAGNEYNQGYQIDDYSLPYAETPDYGLVGSPSTYASSLSVASVENTKLTSVYFTVGENKYGYIDNGPDAMKLKTLAGKTYEYAYAGLGTAEECKEANLEGKVALIQRGSLSFSEKVANASAQGAVAVIIFNNESGTISMSVDPYSVPAVSITLTDGQAMLAAEDKQVTFTDEVYAFDSETAGEMSDFSSWGATATLAIKPEITAPGGNIYSSVKGGGYESMSGTSMAAPQMTGAAAVLRQYVNEKLPGISAVTKMEVVNNLLMSISGPIVEATKDGVSTYYSPRKQGSGLVNVYDAINSGAYLYTGNNRRPKAEMGSSAEGAYEFSFNVKNYSDTAKTYVPSIKVQSDASDSDGKDIYSVLSALGFEAGTDYYSITVNGQAVNSITVAAGETVKVEVKLALSADAKEYLSKNFVNGTYVEGFVFLNSEEAVDLSLPFLGFYGDWDKLQLFDGTAYDGDSYYYESQMNGMFYYKGSYYYYVGLGENTFTGKMDGNNIAYNKDLVRNQLGVDSDAWLSTDTGLLRNASDIFIQLPMKAVMR